MNKEEFIEHFAVTFMATWVANEHSNACMTGNHDMLKEPPVEDAYFLAEKAWEHKQEILG